MKNKEWGTQRQSCSRECELKINTEQWYGIQRWEEQEDRVAAGNVKNSEEHELTLQE